MTINTTLNEVLSLLPLELQSPKIAIVSGSGLSTALSTLLTQSITINYNKLTGFQESTVQGHQSVLIFGKLNQTVIVIQLGRFHYYEGFNSDQVIYPIRLFKKLNVKIVILTNAAGALDSNFKVGNIIIIQDHLSLPSLTSFNPLIGKNIDEFGQRFPAMSDAYDFELRKAAFRASHALKFPKGALQEGIYAWVAGPTYETRAEQRFLRAAGASVVGMSTVPEVIAARHAGIRVLVLSLCTNIVVATPYRSAEKAIEAELAGLESISTVLDEALVENKKVEVATHQEVLEVSNEKAEDMKALIARIIEDLETGLSQ